MRRNAVTALAVAVWSFSAACHDAKPMTPAGPVATQASARGHDDALHVAGGDDGRTDGVSLPDCARRPWFWRCFPRHITPSFPGGPDLLFVNRTCPGLLQGEACSESGMRRIDEMFNVFGWQIFIAVNWPEQRGTPDAAISAGAAPRWASWLSTAGAEGHPPRRSCADVAPGELASYANGDTFPPVSNMVVDRYGRAIVTETRLDAMSADHFERFDSWSKQAFQECNKILESSDPFREVVWGYLFRDKTTTPSSYDQLREKPEPGATRLKLGYRVLDRDDDPSTFVTRREGDRTLGLVAMHIVTKVIGTDDRWVWATFEHVNAVGGPEAFFTPTHCEGHADCPPRNRCAPPKARSQAAHVVRERPLPEPVQALNEQVRARLRDSTSVLQHYQLVGVQWSYPKKVEASTTATVPLAMKPYTARPEILSNAVLEWDRQETDCMGCHRKAATYQLPRAACEQQCPDSPDERCPPAALRSIRPVFSTADFFWKYKDVPGAAR